MTSPPVGRVVIVTTEMGGRVRAAEEMARRLADAGHRVSVLGPPAAAPVSPHPGVSRVPLDSTAAAVDEGLPREIGSVPAVATALANRLGDVGADLWLVDLELPFHTMAAAAAGGRVATWTTLLSVWKRPGLPPPHTPIVPGRGVGGSAIGIEWAWARYRLGRRIGRARAGLLPGSPTRLERLAAAGEVLGFPFDALADTNQWLVPLVWRSIPHVTLNVEELDLPHESPAHVHHVGPMLGPDHDDTPLEPRTPGRPLVYAAFGAWYRGDDRPFIRRVIDAASRRPGVDFLIGLGGRLDPTTVGTIPSNVRVMAWAPQRRALADADVALHHCGISSINECLAAGVPMVAYPLSVLDGPGNAARVAFHGLGVFGDRERDDPATIAAHIDAVLDDPAPAAAVRRIRTAMDAYEGRLEAVVSALLVGDDPP